VKQVLVSSAILAIETEAARLGGMKSWTETIQSNSSKLLEEIRKLTERLEREVQNLKDVIAGLRESEKDESMSELRSPMCPPKDIRRELRRTTEFVPQNPRIEDRCKDHSSSEDGIDQLFFGHFALDKLFKE
jgi:hypothetical protein